MTNGILLSCYAFMWEYNGLKFIIRTCAVAALNDDYLMNTNRKCLQFFGALRSEEQNLLSV